MGSPNKERRPTVFCLSGHDPGGGAGIQADIETVAALGGHALSLISAHTVQDTTDVTRVQPVDVALLREQAAVLLADAAAPGAIKVGLLGSVGQAEFVAQLARQTGAPLVLDPVLRAGGGAELASAGLLDALAALLPQVEVLTPNAAEARRLAPGAGDLDACGRELLRRGARNVLITGGDEAGESVVNRWFRSDGSPRAFAWPRLAGPFHGAGCTLAAAIATLLARGEPVGAALTDAQAWVHQALQRGFAPGKGRMIPGRWS
jgi:hydroxymethylpyrimidine/phosphomethylpyrimidine kinase